MPEPPPHAERRPPVAATPAPASMTRSIVRRPKCGNGVEPGVCRTIIAPTGDTRTCEPNRTPTKLRIMWSQSYSMSSPVTELLNPRTAGFRAVARRFPVLVPVNRRTDPNGQLCLLVLTLGVVVGHACAVTTWPTDLQGLGWGADYNPEQWPEHVWTEDVELMRRLKRHHGQPGHLQLGEDRGQQGRVPVRLARPRDGPAARRRHPRRPRDRDRRAAAVAHHRVPRDAARPRGRSAALARLTAGLLPVVADLPRPGDRAGRRDGLALPRPPRPRRVARRQRVRVPREALLLRHVRRVVP